MHSGILLQLRLVIRMVTASCSTVERSQLAGSAWKKLDFRLVLEIILFFLIYFFVAKWHRLLCCDLYTICITM